MFAKLYEAIRRDAAPSMVKVYGRDYSDKELFPVHTPIPVTLVVTTLTGLVDYLKDDPDNLENEMLICHVDSPVHVSIRSTLKGDFADRACYIQANAETPALNFDKWMEAEAFNIMLQSGFCEADGIAATDRGLVLKYISNVSAVAEAGVIDDGTSQAVTVRKGIAGKAMDVLPNPVTLCPYRTFTEVEQPASSFVFRVKEDGGRLYFMLAEADGGAWRAQAMQNIKAYMQAAIPGLTVIA